MDLTQFWRATLQQDAAAMAGFFHPEAWVNWHCTNEHFTAAAFIQANCAYPGDWDGEILEQIETADVTITITHVYPRDRSGDFYVTSLFRIAEDKIRSLEEYWADAGAPPRWRQAMQLTTPIE